MAWRERMRKGAIRGVPFMVREGGQEGGRRVALHEYPGRATPWAEDMGRKARRWTVEMLALGADYMAARDRLIEALEQPGPAELVHPWLGRLTVQVEGYRLRESSRDGGMAEISVTVVEAGQPMQPAAAVDTQSAVADAGDAARAAADAAFAADFDVTGQPAFVLDSARAAVAGMLDAMDRAAALIRAPADQAAVAVSAISALRSGLDALLLAPADLASELGSALASLAGMASDPLPAMDALRAVGDSGPAASATTPATPARRAEAANNAAASQLIRVHALSREAELAAGYAPPSSGEALGLRDDLAGRIDAAAETASDDTVFAAMQDLHAAVVRDLTTRAASLPSLATIQLGARLPALVAAHRHLGDARRADELALRNNAPHPGFLPAGVPLEVLRA